MLCGHSTAMQQQALSAIVAWVRLVQAIQRFNQSLRKDFGITGLQLAVLRILGERPALPLAALRKSLVMHPATLGQSIDELRVMELVTVDRRGHRRVGQAICSDSSRPALPTSIDRRASRSARAR